MEEFEYIIKDIEPPENENRVTEDTVGNHWVSTVRLSIDHGFDGTPLWYETMVFPIDKDGEVSFAEVYCDRYETLEEAFAGHDNVVKTLKAGELL